MQPALMLVWDARLFPALALVFIHPRLWTVILALAALGAALWLQRLGMSVPAGFRWIRSALAGRRRWATSRPPRGPDSWIEEGEGGWRWNAAKCRLDPPSRRKLRARKRLDRIAEAAARGAEK